MGSLSKASLKPWTAFQARQRNTDVKRDAILHTAARLFLEQGYSKTSLNVLAKRLEITKPALYHYFRNKEEILVECYRAGISYIETMLDGLALSGQRGLDKVNTYVESYTGAVVAGDFGRCVAMLDDADLSADARREVRSLKRRIDTALRTYVQEGISDGSIAPCSPKLASFLIAGAINWIGRWYKANGELGATEIAAEFARLITQGLKAQSGKKAKGVKISVKTKRTRKAPAASRARRAR